VVARLVIESFPEVVGIDINEETMLPCEKKDSMCSWPTPRTSTSIGSSTRSLRAKSSSTSTTSTGSSPVCVGAGGGHGQVHPEHTCWFCEDALRRVLGVNGDSHVEISFSGHRSPTPLRRAATSAVRILLPPRLALDTLIAVATAD